MGIKTETVGYCDVCNKQIRGDVKGFHIIGTVEFLNDDSNRVKDFQKIGVSNSQTINDKDRVLCRGCFANLLGFVDRDSKEYKEMQSSHDSYIDSLYRRGGPGDR